MLLLYKNGKIKNIKDSNNISKYITKDVKYVMIYVGIDDNSEYVLIEAKNIVKYLKTCNMDYVISAYFDFHAVWYGDNYDDVEPFILSDIISINIDTIGKLYSYKNSLNRIFCYNEILNENEFAYNGPIEISNFHFKIDCDIKKKEFSCSYNKETMPFEEENLETIKDNLLFLNITNDITFSKSYGIIIDPVLNRWRKEKIRNNYKFFDSNKVFLNHSEYCLIPINYSKSGYMINSYLYNKLLKARYLYIEAIIYKTDFYFTDSSIKSKMETIHENNDEIGYLSYQVTNISTIMSFFSMKNNLFKMFEITSCLNGLNEEEREAHNYEMIVSFEVSLEIEENKFTESNYEILYTYNPFDVEINDIIKLIDKLEERYDNIK